MNLAEMANASLVCFFFCAAALIYVCRYQYRSWYEILVHEIERRQITGDHLLIEVYE